MTVDGEDINIQNLCMFVKGLKRKWLCHGEKELILGEGIATFYDSKEGKMFTEPVYFFQRDFFALYGENEILG